VPILTLQRQFRELGRIRAGDTEPPAPGKTFRRPKKLATFRLTSSSQALIDQVAAEYGGKAQPWANAPESTGAQWECTIAAAALDVLVPPGETYSQWMELWRGGGCLRRCDGVRELLKDTPCVCPSDPKERTALAAEGKACKPTTRFMVMLPKIPDIGGWRVETHSYYAAVELAGTLEILRIATERGYPLPAKLLIQQRSIKRPNEPRKDFPVIVLSLPDEFSGQLLADPAARLAIGPGPMQTSSGRPDIPHAPEPRGATSVVATAETEDGRAIDDDGVIDAEYTETPDAERRIPLIEECQHAFSERGMGGSAEWTALLRRLFPERQHGQPLNPPQLVELLAAIDAWQTEG
jgi:Recombination directionality factor-like